MKEAEQFRHSKISVSHVPKYLERPRLLEQIHLAGDRSATWIEAPPGSGKTTLAFNYLDHSKNAHIWYQVDSSDHDIASFFYWLGLAIQQAVPENDKSLPLFTAEYSFGLETFGRNFFDEIYSRLQAPFTLVFDNFQLLRPDSPVHDVMTRAIKSLPAGGNLLILSREKPPQQYSRLITNRHLSNIGWDQLRLQEDELEPLLAVLDEADVDPDKQQQLMDMSDGWISGVILILLSQKLKIGHKNLPKTAGSETLFDYFANEVMAAQSDETKRFLRALALLPQFDIEMAADLTANKNAEDIINFLFARNYFLNRLSGNKPRYEFHPLFRGYLLSPASSYYSEKDWCNVKLIAADILERDLCFGRAIELRAQAGDIPNAVRVLCEQAMKLMMQGRYETIRQWIHYFPEQATNQVPWLNYWKGISLLAINPFEALSILEQCYPHFKQQSDVKGMYLCWCAIVDAYSFAWSDFTPANKWVEELEWLGQEYPDYPSADIAVKIVFSAVTLLMWCRPEDPSLEQWLHKALVVQENIPVNDMTIFGLTNVAHLLVLLGRINEARLLHESMEKRIDLKYTSPAVLILNMALRAVLGAFGVQQYRDVHAIIEHTSEKAHASGIHVFTSVVYGMDIYFSVQSGDVALARKRLQQIEQLINPKCQADYSHFYYLTGLVAQAEGDFIEAEKAFRTAVVISDRCSIMLPSTMNRSGLALANIELGKYDEAGACIGEIRQAGEQCNSIAMTCFADGLQAYAMLKQGETTQAEDLLRIMLPRMCEFGFNICTAINARCFARLAACAYRAGIETKYVDKIIKQFGITPFDEQDRVETWPWPCRVQLFGGYRIELQGEEVGSAGKTAKKPKELLLALLTAPHQILSVYHVADLLWPDADGDSASTSLKTTVHRLRKLLADDHYIKVHDGQVQLDSSRLFCDAVEFDKVIVRLNKANDQSQHELEKMISLYQGELADGCDDCYWLHNARERYRNQFINAIGRLGELKHKSGTTSQAIEIYQKGLNVDSLAEDLYAGLMACYLSTGNASQGLKVYALCRDNLKSRLAITPADSTQKIARQLDALASTTRG